MSRVKAVISSSATAPAPVLPATIAAIVQSGVGGGSATAAAVTSSSTTSGAAASSASATAVQSSTTSVGGSATAAAAASSIGQTPAPVSSTVGNKKPNTGMLSVTAFLFQSDSLF